ncbi:MAG: tripartite tricarboxylate transporter substrate binding protein [Synergistaceae bacterium]|jgi:tripartite-type tricarboxylate transporter receptor subunit TctC|nr:tripartite tricarboxylate transporter substrate binding protein [Synergistaceae bacterium]
MKRVTRVFVLSVLLIFVLFGFAAAGEKYPDQALTMIVNYSAGGGTDLAARALAEAASKPLGQPVGITNITGGSGTVGIAELKNNKNDGYTIGVATLAPLTIVPWQLEVPYTPDDFEYICAFGQYGYGLVVRADSPYNSVEDLLKAAKASGKMNYGATGYPQPFAMEALGKAAGVSFFYVTYADTTALITDILGGFIECALCDQASFISYVKSGQMKLLASATDKRWDVAPDAPTLQELGYDVALLSYMGLCAPAGLDEAVLKTLRDAFATASKDGAYREIVEKSNLVYTWLPGEDYKRLVYEKYEEYKKLFSEIAK